MKMILTLATHARDLMGQNLAEPHFTCVKQWPSEELGVGYTSMNEWCGTMNMPNQIACLRIPMLATTQSFKRQAKRPSTLSLVNHIKPLKKLTRKLGLFLTKMAFWI